MKNVHNGRNMKLKHYLLEAGLIEPQWAKDEEIWNRAKKAATKAKPDDLYALTTYLYQKMGGKIATNQSDTSGVRTLHWFYGVEAFLGSPSESSPELVDAVEPTPSADLAAQKLLIENPNMPAATLLNALKAQGIDLVDQKQQLQADTTSSQTAVLKSFRKTEADIKFHATARFLEGAANKNAGVGPIRFKVALIQEGLGNLKDAFFYSKNAIQSGIQAFEGRKCFADHPSSTEERDRPERSVRDIIGHFENVQIQENEDESLALIADLVMPPDPPFEWARALVREAARFNQKYPEQNLVGLSINASGDAHEVPFDEFLKEYRLPDSCKPKLMKARENGMETVKVVSAIRDAVSCDLVTEPGARGAIIEILESETPEEKETMKKKEQEKKAKIEKEEEKKMMMAAEDEEEKKAKAAESEDEAKHAEDEEEKDGADDEDHADVEQDKKLILDMIKKYMGDEDLEGEGEEAAMEAYEAYKSMGESEDEAMKCAGKAMKLAKHMAGKKESEEKHESEDEAAPKKESAVKLEARIAFLERELKKRELADFLDKQLKESGLGRAETDKIRKLVGAPKSEGEITKTIKIFKEAFAGRSESAPKSGFFINLEKPVAPVKRSKVSFNDCI